MELSWCFKDLGRTEVKQFYVLLDCVCRQPYRTTPLVLPHAKTIHDTVPPAKFLNQHQHAEAGQVVQLKI